MILPFMNKLHIKTTRQSENGTIKLKKLSKTASLFLITILHFSYPVFGWEEKALNKLKETKECAFCDLSGADLRWANIYGAEIAGAANLVNANLQGANLKDANLYGANLEGANLSGANLQGVNINWASLYNANLQGSNTHAVDFTGVTLCKTVMSDGTVNNINCR